MKANSSERGHWERFWRDGRGPDEIYSTQDRILNALEAVFQPGGKRVLEVGAGTGRDSLRLAQKGARVVTLDLARSAVELIRRQANASKAPLAVVQSDAFAMPFGRNTFDLVFHQGLLEHFRDPQPLLRANTEVLKPGGILLVDVPQKYHLYTAVKHVLIWLNAWFAGWETEFTIRRLESVLEEVGLQPILRYGDWMRPSFAYRSLREAAQRIGFRLPMYPRSLPGVERVRSLLRGWARKRSWVFYTYLDIGVIAEKPDQPSGEGSRSATGAAVTPPAMEKV